MLAVIGAICFLLALIWEAAPFDLLVTGLLFCALHLAFTPWLGPWPFRARP